MKTPVMAWATSNRSGMSHFAHMEKWVVSRLIIVVDARIVDSLGFRLSVSVG
jgi:hypothetical protein